MKACWQKKTEKMTVPTAKTKRFFVTVCNSRKMPATLMNKRVPKLPQVKI